MYSYSEELLEAADSYCVMRYTPTDTSLPPVTKTINYTTLHVPEDAETEEEICDSLDVQLTQVFDSAVPFDTWDAIESQTDAQLMHPRIVQAMELRASANEQLLRAMADGRTQLTKKRAEYLDALRKVIRWDEGDPLIDLPEKVKFFDEFAE